MLSDFTNKTGYIWPLHELITQSAKLTFSGWEDVSPQDNVEAVFHFIPEDDQKFAYDQFFRKLGKYRFIDIKNVFQAKKTKDNQ